MGGSVICFFKLRCRDSNSDRKFPLISAIAGSA